MQRRDLITSLALLFVTIREGSLFFKKTELPSEDKKNQFTPTSAKNKTVQLNANSKFLLPTDPIDGLTLYFQPAPNTKSYPSVIVPADSHNIMNSFEHLEIDETILFALTFNAEYKSWILSTQVFENTSINKLG